ncbi:hypothetical protein V474_01275 [Novosphingobium barchaimii LL02]|uniref:Uncharacterized protein n=1 Tax=Novosphingobium barchaimii LL02 TaxID=1114963 RepID=A0A0J7Y9E3_9SPHN|nr:hypothetical protein V474_01275 [Novosphingobium barchaimii LL02]
MKRSRCEAPPSDLDRPLRATDRGLFDAGFGH